MYDRFGMAEQAINTIYLLGEQPDALCGDIIKSYTLAAFLPKSSSTEKLNATEGSVDGDREPHSPVAEAPQGDTIEAFRLSQLVFLVGHVAFKHIVYLELVEREIKRRKEVTAKGTVDLSSTSSHYSHAVLRDCQRRNRKTKTLISRRIRTSTSSSRLLERPRTIRRIVSPSSAMMRCCTATNLCLRYSDR